MREGHNSTTGRNGNDAASQCSLSGRKVSAEMKTGRSGLVSAWTVLSERPLLLTPSMNVGSNFSI